MEPIEERLISLGGCGMWRVGANPNRMGPGKITESRAANSLETEQSDRMREFGRSSEKSHSGKRLKLILSRLIFRQAFFLATSSRLVPRSFNITAAALRP